MTYSVRRPISSDQNLRREGAVVSVHRTLSAARKALARQKRGTRQQGGYSQDYMWDDDNDCEAEGCDHSPMCW
jgi:hypothetical protein